MTQQLSNPADRLKIKKMLAEISNSMTRIDAEKDLIRETIKEMSDQFQLPKRTLTKMAKVYHKQNFQQEVQSHEEFESLYESVVNND